MRLGRLQHDPARLALAPRLVAASPPPPVLDRSAVDFSPMLYQNNVLPNCSAVGLANSARAAAALAGFDLVVDPDSVPAYYAACIGRPGASEAELEATEGAVLMDVLDYMQANGFEVGQQVPLVANYDTVSADSRSAIASAMTRPGAGYWGVDLYERDMELLPVWDDDGRDPGALVGGHCLLAFDYAGLNDQDTIRLGTWGAWQPATWRWAMSRLREAHGVTWPQIQRV